MTEITIKEISNGWVVIFNSDLIVGGTGEFYATTFPKALEIVSDVFKKYHGKRLVENKK